MGGVERYAQLVQSREKGEREGKGEGKGADKKGHEKIAQLRQVEIGEWEWESVLEIRAKARAGGWRGRRSERLASVW